MYETNWGSGVAHSQLVDSSSPTPASGSAYQIVPVNINLPTTYSFTIKATMVGGAVFQLACTLKTVCGATAPIRSFAPGAGFLTTETLIVQHSVTVQTMTFPEFIDSA